MRAEKAFGAYRWNIKVFLNGLQAHSALTHHRVLLSTVKVRRAVVKCQKKSQDVLCFLTLVPKIPQMTAKQAIIPHLLVGVPMPEGILQTQQLDHSTQKQQEE